MRNKCDKLLTPIVKAKNPRCLLCPSDTQVAHHHMKKSTSASCRYYLPNLIPLCHRCHMRLHADEILWAGRVIELKGIDWLRDLEEQKKKYVKTDVHYYIEQYELLSLHL
jgi:5-methylcytosine-specific restriction endonuclease McrA